MWQFVFCEIRKNYRLDQMQRQTPPKCEEDFDQDFGVEGALGRKISELSDLHLRYTYSNTSSSSEYGQYEQNACTQQFQSKFIRDDELYNDMLAKLPEVKNYVNIENDEICLYLYQHYGWNLEKFINFFNEDWSQLKANALNYQSQQQQNEVTAACPVCLEQAQLYTSGTCAHRYCQNCWRGYIRAELQAGHIFFGCMDEAPCHQAPVLRGFVQRVVPQLKQLYRKKICMSYAIQNKDVCYCPNQKCPNFCSKPSLMQIGMVNCPCGEMYCFRCEQEPHAPATCLQVQKWREIINSEQTNMNWIKNNTRECPKCHQPIQKKVGCSHMKCICTCQFCYECKGLWDQPHLEMKGECPKRKQLAVKEKLTDRVVELDQSLTILMKEAERHENSLRLCETLVQEEAVLNKVIQVKVEVMCAWTTLKWSKILLALQNKAEVEKIIQNDFVSSIRSTMQPVQNIIKSHNTMATRDLYHEAELVLQRKEALKKNKSVWLEAFENNYNY